MPRISVAMPVLNGEPYLRSAIDSVLAQTFEDFEFIIVDDGSSDSTVSTIKSYADPRVKLIQQPHQGIAAALNNAIASAQGEFIARQDADDLSEPERFARQIYFLDSNPGIAVLGTASLLIDSDSRAFSRFMPFTSHDRLVKELMRGVCPLMHGSILMRRAAVRDAGGYNPAFELLEDVELWLRMSPTRRLSNLRDMLYQYRKHDGTMTKRAQIDLKIRRFAQTGKLSPQTRLEDWLQFSEHFDYTFPGSAFQREFEAENLLRQAQIDLAHGEAWQATKRIVQALQLYPRIVGALPGRVGRRLWRTCLVA